MLYIENYPCCAFLCKRPVIKGAFAQKGAAGIIFDIFYDIDCMVFKRTCLKDKLGLDFSDTSHQ